MDDKDDELDCFLPLSEASDDELDCFLPLSEALLEKTEEFPWCDECEGKNEGVHQLAEQYSGDQAVTILEKPKEWRRHLLAKLREHMCLSCGDCEGVCYCENAE